MRIVEHGRNPYIKRVCCMACGTEIEVDIRTDCKKEVSEYQAEHWCWWETRSRPDYTWLRIVNHYTLACPVCSERIVAFEEYDDSREADARRKSRY